MVEHDPALDHPFEGEMPSPDFAEAQMWNFSDGDFGLASAISWLLFLVIAALTWGNGRLFGKSGAADVER